MKQLSNRSSSKKGASRMGARASVEPLEVRRLMAVNTAAVQALPYALDFSGDRGATTYADKDGQGTGFTYVQANRLGNQYQPSLVDLDTAAGLLRVTTTGSASTGSNFNLDNTLTNALGTQFNGTAGTFAVTVRLRGPLGFIDQPFEQGGVMFGPDQDNYVKLVAASTLDAFGRPAGQKLQFIDEQLVNGSVIHTVSLDTSIGSFANVTSLDLRLTGDPATGVVFASYAVNGGSFVQLPQAVTIDASKRSAFFNGASRAGVVALHKNGVAPVTMPFDSFAIARTTAPATQSPRVTAVRPGAGATNVRRDAFVATDLALPNVGHGVDVRTLSSNNVRLFRTSDGQQVPGRANTSGGGDSVVLQPRELLDANTQYTFQVTAGLKDTSGAAFQAFTSTFTTGTAGGTADPSIAFEQVQLPTAANAQFTTLAMGPDGRLYAGTYQGNVHRWDINADGTLGAATVFGTVQAGNGGAQRSITGIAFGPEATAANPVLYVSHGAYALPTDVAPEWSGKVSKLTGASLSTYADLVTGLPRSIGDHLTNQIAFGPDGALYVSQGSNTAYGDADSVWGMRPERLLNAAILRVDVRAITGPVNVKTEEGGTYNPFATGALVTLYATGVRNGYDLVWHTNGRLYVPTNGSAAGGNTPGFPSNRFGGKRIDGAYTSPNVPALRNLQQTESDWIHTVAKGGYYGHPNPTRGEFVLNGGNPTSGADAHQVGAYPVGTQPDRNYRGNPAKFGSNAVYALGQNFSPDGVIEYKGTAFGGKLNGKLLVARFAGGDDIAIVTLNGSGGVASVESGYAGLGRLNDPLDLVQGRNGAMYVSEFGGQKLTLVRPVAATAKIEVAKKLMAFNDVRGGATGPGQALAIRNVGTTALGLPADAFTITGPDATQFVIKSRPAVPGTLAAGSSADVVISFNPPDGAPLTVRTATLVIKSSDPATPTVSVELRGLPTAGIGGQNEPSLQRILDLWKVRTNVGDDDPNTTVYPAPSVRPNDEVEMPRLLKADASKPVSVELLAMMGVNSNPAVRFGYHGAGSPTDRTEVFSVPTADAQSVHPFTNGPRSFDPGTADFGLYTMWPNFKDNGQPRVASSEDVYNTWEPNNNLRKKARFFTLRDAAGAVVPNAYVVAFEEFTQLDFNDMVAIVRNVKPAPLQQPEMGIRSVDGSPFANRLVFNQIVVKNTTVPNEPHDRAQLVINNSGPVTLAINSVTFTGPFELAAPAPTSVGPGQSVTVTVRFTATGGSFHSGVMSINTNDANEPGKFVELAGHWQPESENFKEPSLQGVVDMLGYKTRTSYSGQNLDGGGLVQAIGDEVLSPFWVRAYGSQPVTVRQLAAYHQQGQQTLFAWYAKGAGTTTTLFRHARPDGQTILPNNEANNGPAYGEFNPTTTFGLRIDAENSDDTRNVQERPGGNYGHHVRFYPAKDRGGNVMPNAWLVVMDYNGINYDYQDNMYLVTNMRPEKQPAQPAALYATAFAPGVELRWAANGEGDLAGYNVYRATSEGGTYARLATASVGTSFFDSTSATPGTTYVYRVTAVNGAGAESTAATTSAVRVSAGSGTAQPPAPPAGAANLFASSADIGSPTPGGSSATIANNSAYDVRGGGAGGIANAADQFRFTYRQLTGAFDYRVRVAGLTNTSPFAAAGLMARESLAAGSRFFMAAANPGQTIADYRDVANADTKRAATGSSFGTNTWLRLARSGSTVTAYVSGNGGSTWTTLASLQLNLSDPLFVGLAVTSKNGSSVATGQFRDLTLG